MFKDENIVEVINFSQFMSLSCLLTTISNSLFDNVLKFISPQKSIHQTEKVSSLLHNKWDRCKINGFSEHVKAPIRHTQLLTG